MEFIGLKGGLIMSAIAFSIVFIVIIGLMFIMIATSKIAKSLTKKNDGVVSKNLDSTVNLSNTTTKQANMSASDTTNDDIIAAIVGTVIASSDKNIRICSIQEAVQGHIRRPSTSIWKISARTTNFENCF